MSGGANDRPDSAPVWLVTGASKGIGREVVRAALEAGASVVAGSREPETMTRWAADDGAGDRLLSVRLEVTDEASVAEAVRAAVGCFGRIDVLVNNAGYLFYGAVEELSDAEVQRSFGVNVFGLLNVTRAVLAVMRAQRSGHVVNMASISANVTSPGVGLYSATKAAVLMFTEALAQEGAELGIRATAICPGGVRTDFLDDSWARRAETTLEDYRSVHQVETALGHANHRQGGDPRKVAHAIVAVTELAEPPSRLYLGTDAVNAVVVDQQKIVGDVAHYLSLSESIARD